MKTLEILAMIYKSLDYLNLIVTELKKDYCKVDGWAIEARIIANNATPEVLDAARTCGIPYSIYNDSKPNDYYLNRVYRCWNYAGSTSIAENICFVNSDMIFSTNWLKNLLNYHNGINIPTSRLVESGKLLSGMHGISHDFGRTPATVDYVNWEKFADQMKINKVFHGGLYMPCVFNKKRFIESGMYPEGNIYSDGKAGSLVGQVVTPGDIHFFNRLEKEYDMNHISVFDSLVYHIQEGELDERK
jgi:hypothetical protein